MNTRRTYLLDFLIWLNLLPSAFPLLEQNFVAFQESQDSIPIHVALVVHDIEEHPSVYIAAGALVEDLGEITGSKPRNTTYDNGLRYGNGTAETAIVVGTVGSSMIKNVAENATLDVDGLEGKWETFGTALVSHPLDGVEQALVIFGSDMRGTAFGVYTLAEQSGQSPYHFWADVPASKHESIYAINKTTTHGEPSVKYRGLLISDEAPALTGWWSRCNNEEHRVLDSNFHRHVFDMVARLRPTSLGPRLGKRSSLSLATYSLPTTRTT